MGSLITVLVTFYNPGDYILQTIKSVIEQTYQDWKMILVNDASTDNSVELIQDFLRDSRIKLVEHNTNQGQSKSLNTGLQHIETPFFVQLDADDWFYPNTLEILIKETKNLPENYALVSGNINIVFENGNRSITRNRIKKGQIFSDRYEFMKANCSVWPRCYRTLAVKEIGGWPIDDPYEGRFIEDLRILYRLIENYRFHWIDEVLMFHRRHLNNQTNQIREMSETYYWIIINTLKRWGDQYIAHFNRHRDGSLSIKKLIKKN